MGLCLSSEERAERNHSKSIDRTIKKDGVKLRMECKILLLGSGESGKSTIVKQMKVIHQNGYTEDELYTWRSTVYKNIIESAQAIVAAINKYEYEYQNEKNKCHAERIASYLLGNNTNVVLDKEIVIAINCIWTDEAVAKLLDQESSGFYLMDSASYFFDEIKRIGESDYLPTTQDVLQARSKTTGITETRFSADTFNIHMFDVGGQRSERKKWIHCFEAVTTIIFCVSLSEYDQTLLEESRQNRMMESLVLFESVINSRWFIHTSIVLLLNKVDVLKAKLPKVPLERYFPDYKGGKDYLSAARYFDWRFKQTNRANLRIYTHCTQATSTSNIRVVFHAIKETTLRNSLRESGML
ncbi:G protein alpha subunit [Phycomyces blakesleeanus]|uniref:G protein alpha subunit n=1 Tax=Phycomyces blakesleeanus TaxID=4837 RepID=A0ABR3AYF6_PHYBL